jgi:hypothetical protein
MLGSCMSVSASRSMHCFHGLQVWAAELYGMPVALKLPGSGPADGGSPWGSFEDAAAAAHLLDEAAVLEALRPLQGVCVPRLIAYGSIISAVGAGLIAVDATGGYTCTGQPFGWCWLFFIPKCRPLGCIR